MHTPFPDLANGWADCVQIWCVSRDPLDKSSTQAIYGMHLHVRTCTPLFPISHTVWRIVLKFGVWLGIHSMILTQVRCGANLHVRTCTLLSHDGALAVARPSPIKAPCWYHLGASKRRQYQEEYLVHVFSLIINTRTGGGSENHTVWRGGI